MPIGRTGFLNLVFLLFLSHGRVLADSGPVNDAILSLIDDLKASLPEISEKTKSSALTSFTLSDKLPEDTQDFFLKTLEGIQANNSEFKFSQCKECLVPRVENVGEETFIKKGVLDEKDLAKFLSPLGVASYAEASLMYSGTRMSLIINFYNVKDRSLLISKTFHKRVLNATKSGFKTSLAFAQFMRLSSPSSYPFGGHAFFAERIYGFGEFGLGVLGHGSEGTMKSYVSLGPDLRLNLNEIFNKSLNWGAIFLTLHMHYGWYGNHRDISFGGGTKIEIGSIYHMLVEYYMGQSLQSKKPKDSSDTSFTTDDTAVDKVEESAAPATILVGFGFDWG